jgi:hypothetical protein
MEPSKKVETLEDLIQVVAHREDCDTIRMLRTLTGHLSLAVNKAPGEIMLTELAGLRHPLRAYLGKKEEEGEFTRNTVRSYMNYFRILLKKASKLGATGYSPEIEMFWAPMAAALATEYGCRDIVRDAVAKGIPPKEYSEQHLKCWCEQMATAGRHPNYVRIRVSEFRRKLVFAGLSDLLPKLSFTVGKQNYGVPLEEFPEPLQTEAKSVLEWKLAPYC